MKKSLFFLCVFVSSANLFSQEWTTGSGLIYSNNNKVSIGATSVQGTYGTDTPVLQLVAPSTSSSFLTLKSGAKGFIFGTGPYGNALYINDNDPFNFSYGANSVLNINSNGNIGIGTTSPAEKLHINGSIRGNRPSGALRVRTTSGYLDLGAQNTAWAHIYTDRPKIIFNKDIYTSSNAFSSYNNDLILKTKGTERLRIDDVSGNATFTNNIEAKGVIINSTTVNNWIPLQIGAETKPGRRNIDFVVKPDQSYIGFEIFGKNQKQRQWIDFRDNSTNVAYKDAQGVEMIKFHHNNDNGRDMAYIHMPKLDSRIVIGEYGGYLRDEGHKLVVKNGTAMIENAIYTNGEIGIGTTNTQGYKLAVAGKIAAEEVKVALQVNWPDYVFENNYTLPTLQQVENHITTKGHLINIPSASEVSENGIQLGEMNAKLLEKIEELTLYTIAQEKKLKEQETINLQLTTNNQNLEARLAKIEALLSKE